MERFIVKGGKKLKGKVKVSGAKNATLKLMAAALLTDEPITLSNTPRIQDIYIMGEVLERLGVQVDMSKKGEVTIKSSGLSNFEAPYDLVSRMRASIIVLGPLLGRLGKAKVAMPGGCNIGIRKIDLHLKGLGILGADIKVEHGFIEASAKVLKGDKIFLDFPSVGATENLLMTAVLAKGTTIIENAAREPEIVDLISFLNEAGAKISGGGTNKLEIEGVERLKGVSHRVIPDRIEAGTFAVAGAITGGEVIIEDALVKDLEMVLDKLKKSGVDIEEMTKEIRVRDTGVIGPVDIVTLPYPGFPTDMQPQLIALLSLAQGASVVTENVFENRFMFVDELRRMGCDVSIHGHHAIVRGVSELSGAPVRATDLRGGAALVLAGLAAKGVTEVENIFHIDRGYEDFEEKLTSVGADVSRVSGKKSKAKLAIV